MKTVAADWLPYALPLRKPWLSSRGSMTERQGRLFRLQSAEGLTGWGDCAPLPEFGISEASAAAFAEETAQLDLQAQRTGLSFNAWLSGKPPVSRIAVNDNGGALSTVTPDMLVGAAQAGFSIVKLKLGVRPVADEIAALQKLACHLPAALSLRFDANRAWRFAEARSFIAACAGLPVEGLEEPLAEPTAAQLADLQADAAFPLAIDESVELLDQGFFHHPPVQRIVIKPARHGSLLACVELALHARTSQVEVVITSSLESACGLLACAHLAAAVAPDAVHGLATADWLAEDTGMAPVIDRGCMVLPGSPGLGFKPDYKVG